MTRQRVAAPADAICDRYVRPRGVASELAFARLPFDPLRAPGAPLVHYPNCLPSPPARCSVLESGDRLRLGPHPPHDGDRCGKRYRRTRPCARRLRFDPYRHTPGRDFGHATRPAVTATATRWTLPAPKRPELLLRCRPRRDRADGTYELLDDPPGAYTRGQHAKRRVATVTYSLFAVRFGRSRSGS